MTIAVYSKAGCGRCVAAKEKIRLMKFEYQEHDIEYHTRHHEGWRTDGSVEVTSAYHGMDTLPLIRIGDRFYDYVGAMSTLKKHLREQLIPAAEAVPATVEEAVEATVVV